MKQVFATIISLFSFTAVAVPPAGTLPFRESVKQSQVYQVALQSLGVIEEPTIETIRPNGEDMPEVLRQGTCKWVIASRSGVLLRVTARTNENTVALFFGSISGLDKDTVLCE